MSWEEERPIYVKKLRGIMEGIDKILALKGNRVVTRDMEEQLKKLRTDAALLLPKLEKDEFEIAVVGLESSGKSTFTNALLDCMFVPSKQERCTFTSTCIRSGETDAAEISFFKRTEFVRAFQPKLDEMKLPDLNGFSIDTLSITDFNRIFEAAPQSVQKNFKELAEEIHIILHNWSGIEQWFDHPPKSFGSEALHTEDFQGFITNPAKAIAVKQIQIYSAELRNLEMQNAIMHDVPGFNSGSEMHTRQTIERMKSADAIIMIAKADEPSLTGEVRNIFKQADLDGTYLSDKLFVFANKADRTNSVQNTRAKTEAEFVSRHILAPETAPSRIILGSASAYIGSHLNLFGKLSPDEQITARDALRGLKDRQADGLTDGIVEIRRMLKTYHAEVRSKILRRRVDQIPPAVMALFQGKADELNGPIGDRAAFNRLTLRVQERIRKTLVERLNEFKSSVNAEVGGKRILSAGLRAYILENINEEVCKVSKEETRKISLKIVGVNPDVELPQKVDALLREVRFRTMYDAFSTGVLGKTSIQHSNVCNHILEIFLSTVDPALAEENRHILQDTFAKLCGMQKNQDESYYQSLVERFSRDLFEILLKFDRAGRLNKFRQEAANFFSLGVYYNASLAGESGEQNDQTDKTDGSDGSDRTDALAFVRVPLEESPLWRLLLYPETAVQPNAQAVIARIRSLTGLSEHCRSVVPLVEKLIAARGSQAMDEIDHIFADFQQTNSEAATRSRVIDTLQEALDSMGSPAELLDEILHGNRYQQDVAAAHANYNYAVVRDEFGKDVKALQMALIHAFLPAIDLDKAFCARETKLIEDVVELVEHKEEFQNFIADHLHLIAQTEADSLISAETQNRKDAAVRAQIRDILSIIDAVPE